MNIQFGAVLGGGYAPGFKAESVVDDFETGWALDDLYSGYLFGECFNYNWFEFSSYETSLFIEDLETGWVGDDWGYVLLSEPFSLFWFAYNNFQTLLLNDSFEEDWFVNIEFETTLHIENFEDSSWE